MGECMRDVVRGTWLATVLFVVSIVGVGLLLGWIHPPRLGFLVVAILIVTPPTWWLLVSRRGPIRVGRGAVAGALSLAIIFAIPIVLLASSVAKHGTGEGLGAQTTEVGFAVVLGVWLVAMPFGALIGALVAMLQRRGQSDVPNLKHG